MKIFKQPFRLSAILLGAVLCVYALYPKGVSYTNLGIWAIFGIGALIVVSATIIPILKNRKPKAYKTLRNVAVGSFSALFAFLIVAGVIIYAVPKNADKAPDNAVCVVLGARIIEDRPSLSLKNRLDAAIEYLNANPNSVCIVSGGQGADEKFSEAFVMKNYLVENGISENRIISEDKSRNTKENIAFSKELCEQRGIEAPFVLCTDSYHQYRAMLVASGEGVESYALNSRIIWYVEPIYFIREILALFKYFIL